jgi:C_GCAxxG_C_C family probable redox protein
MEISMNSASNIAVARFSQGFACSQAVFTTFATEFGLSDEMALKIAAPFGGGMARTGKICGAVTGSLLALGLKYGYTTPDGRDATYGIAREFMNRFEDKHGSLSCRDFIGFDITTPENRERARAAGVFESICPNLVCDAAEIVQVLLENKP